MSTSSSTLSLLGGEHPFGVFTARQAVRAGISYKVLARLERDGVVIRLHRGVYGLVESSGTHQQIVAACVATGGVASHFTAARLWGFDRAPERPIHLTVARSGRSSMRRNLVVHVTSSRPQVVRCRSIPACSPARTVADLAAIGAPDGLVTSFVGHLMATKAVDYDSLTARLAHASARVPGVLRARFLVRQLGGPLESVAEVELLGLLASWGVPAPVTQHAINPGGDRRYRADFAWPSCKLVLELDGFRYHSAPAAFERDRERHNALVAGGWRVLRTTPSALRRRPEALREALMVVLARSAPSSRDLARTRAGTLRSCHVDRRAN